MKAQRNNELYGASQEDACGKAVAAAGLPEFCFTYAPDAAPGQYVRAVWRGEPGYSPTTYDERDPEKAKALVQLMNKKLGVSDIQAECMFVGSMFGWDTPGASLQLVQAAATVNKIGARLKTFDIGEISDFKVGDPVVANGYRGTVVEVCTGQLSGMVEVRVPGGVTCVPGAYPNCYPAVVNGIEVVTDGRYSGAVAEVNEQFVAQESGRGKTVVHEIGRFDAAPKVGEILDVQYKGAKAVVAETKNNSKSNER